MGNKNTSENGYTYSHMKIPSKIINMRDKVGNVAYYVRKWLTECATMLEFEGLPETIPARDLKILLQNNGFAILPNPSKIPDGKPYAFDGGLGGEPDVYYNPTNVVISNPALKWSATLELHKDAVLVRHDTHMMGLIPMLCHYATMTVDADLSLYIASILSRAPVHISAQGDRSKSSADEYMKGLEDGKLSAIFESGFLDGIRSNPGSTESNQSITNLIEYRQYLKASRWNECGLNANYNMKREAINSAESQMNNDALTPYTDDIITNIQTGLDEYNALYGFNIKVRLGGAWANKQREIDATIEMMENNTEPDVKTEPVASVEPIQEDGGTNDV